MRRGRARYVVRVRAFTVAGLFAEAVSDGVDIDLTVPIGGLVNDGHYLEARDVALTSSFALFAAHWYDMIDPESGIDRCGRATRVCISRMGRYTHA